MKQVKYPLVQKSSNNLKVFSVAILDFLWMNSIFTGISQLIYGIEINSKTRICENFFKKFSSNALRLFFQSKLSVYAFTSRCICWDFLGSIKSFVVLSNSRKFLNALIKKVQSFLLTQSLQMPTDICRIL